MRIAVMAAGAVGAWFGGRLAVHGEEVALIARGAHLAAIRADGLRLHDAAGETTVRPALATDDPGAVGPVDAVLFTPKLWDTAEAAAACRPLVGADTIVISLQNGIVAADVLAETLGREHVGAGVAGIAARIDPPGTIRRIGAFAEIRFGELDNARTARIEALRRTCVAAGIDAEVPPDIHRAVWQKFVLLVGFSGITSVTRKPAGAIRSDPDTRALLVRAMEETATVARAKGVAIADGFVEERLAFIDSMPPETTSSMAGDLAQGRRLELDWLAGTVARLGAELEVDTPVNAFVAAALKLSAGGQGAP